ncbi:type II toxin-antitoxin system VapB family antitoxin [Arthrobacter castelli]|uniref:type II toxin-antitoxin system VapB family antitoxin n=1 Tax=Arthrobacter castelli TaxID=271431 RepID=UPI0004176CE0|nr:type II toxin-antitoxin system VapB family antitoxin [Arthrobacter castelli]
MMTAKLFRSNQSQAVRLPKSLEMPAAVSEVAIFAIGETRVLAPVDMVWDSWFDEPVVSDDLAREQPPEQDREAL